MRRQVAVVSVVVVFAIAACGGIRTDVAELPAPNFSPNAGGFALAIGNSTVTGSGFARQRGGGVVSCAGNVVYLMPDTDFYAWVITPVVEERVDTSFGFDSVMGRDEMFPIADRLVGEPGRYVRTTSCDIDGRFELNEAPQGAYLVVTVITWFVPGSGQQGGPVFGRVSVDGTESVEVTLTNVG